jgi:hypothetical protein
MKNPAATEYNAKQLSEEIDLVEKILEVSNDYGHHREAYDLAEEFSRMQKTFAVSFIEIYEYIYNLREFERTHPGETDENLVLAFDITRKEIEAELTEARKDLEMLQGEQEKSN